MSMGINMNSLDVTWVRQQARSFTAWLNMQLKDRGIALDYEHLPEGLESGVAICELFNALRAKRDDLSGVAAIKANMNPKMRVQKIENASRAIKAIADNFKLRITTSAEEVVNGELKLILGLMWMIICRVDVNDISEAEMTARDGLLAWCKRITAPYEGVKIDDFTHSWQSGLGFLALAHAYDKSTFDYNAAHEEYEAACAEGEAAAKAARAANHRRAYDLIEQGMDIPSSFLDADEMADTTVRPDDKSVVVYLSQIYSRFAGRQQFDQAANAINRVVSQLKQLEAIQNQYEEAAKAILAEVAEHEAEYAENALYETEEAAREASRTAKAFLYDTHGPKLQLAMADANALFQSIQTRRKADGRAAFVPAEGLEPETVFATLDAFFNQVRARISHAHAEIVRHYELKRATILFNAAVAKANNFVNNQVKPVLDRAVGGGRSLDLQERIIEQLLADQVRIANHCATLPELVEKITALNGEAEDVSAIVAAVEQAKVDLEERLTTVRAVRDEEEAVFQKVSAGAEVMRQVYNDINDVLELVSVPLAADSLEEANQGLESYRTAAANAEAMAENVAAAVATAAELLAAHAELLADFTALTDAQIQAGHEEAISAAARMIEDAEAIVQRLTAEREAAAAVIERANGIAEVIAPHSAAVEAAAAIAGVDEALAAWNGAMKAITEANLGDEIAEAERHAAISEDETAISAVTKLAAEHKRIMTTATEAIQALNRQKLAAAELEVPAEVLEEWSASFKKFDKDASGSLDKVEIMALCVASDLAVPENKINALFGSDETIGFDRFAKFMQGLRAQGTTAEGIAEAFATLSNGSETISEASLNQHFDEEMAAYLRTRLTPAGEGIYTFAEFANAAFM